MNLLELKKQVLGGAQLGKEEAVYLALETGLEPLCEAADEIRRSFCGSGFDLCSIVNGKSGRCSEDCKYCAQSAHYPSDVEEYPLLDADALADRAASDWARGVQRFSVVTSGRALNGAELDAACASYQKMKACCGISLCASHGLLPEADLQKLAEAGVTRYHCNLETSRRNFPNICTTHTYEEKCTVLKNASRAGLELCSGGIIGLGETMEDRIDLALELRELGVRSVPLNVLNPIQGTPFAGMAVLTIEEVRRTAAIFRFLLPDAALRLAGGRGLLHDKGESVFRSGANAAITGDMLTTAGISVETDIALLKRLDYEVTRL